jgi:hypothetical protein
MFSSVKPRRSHVFAAALAAAALAVPAFAAAAKAPATVTELSNASGYCPTGGTNAPTGTAVGKASLAAASATSEGFHPVSVDVRVRAGKLAAGTYDVYLVNLYRDDAGQVIGCSATAFAQQLTVKSGHAAEFKGSSDRYTGQYELEVYVGQILGAGYSSAPASVDVP